MKKYYIPLIGQEDNQPCEIITEKLTNTCKIELNFQEIHLKSESTDFFEALCEIREQLEPWKLIPFCYGASLNVYPSGMSRDMGSGLTAYKMAIGKHVNQDDLVSIFEQGYDIIPSYVAKQKEFFSEWVTSERT